MTLRLLPLVLALAACGGDGTKDSGAPDASDGGEDGEDGGGDSGGDGRLEPISEDPLCDEAPIVTWSSWGEGFVIGSCQACHSSTSTDREGAPADVNFDTRDEVLARKARILERSTGDSPSMPPEGGVLNDDRQLLEIWLTCWE